MGAKVCRSEECLLHTKSDEADNSSNFRLPSPLVILTMVVLTCIVLLVLAWGIKHCILQCRRSIRHQDKEHQPANQEKSPSGDSNSTAEGGSGGLPKYSQPLSSSPFWRFSSSPSRLQRPQRLVSVKYDYPKCNQKVQREAEYQNSGVVIYNTVYEEMD